MKYDFDTVISRAGTDSMKWDLQPGELPMWVADMDFATAPQVQQVIQERAAHGIYGYTVIPDEWYEAYCNWWKKKHHFVMEKDWLIFTTGVVPAISSMVRKLTTPNENVLILTPVYNIFFNSIVNNGCRVLECPLQYHAGAYAIDWDLLEKGLANPQTSLMIFCNPHNPVGKIWSLEEMARIGKLCKKYGVMVISDEIHCELTKPGLEYVPFAAVSEVCRDISVTCISPSKAFNLAGLQGAAVCVPEPFLRHKVWRGLNTDEAAEPNVFACIAAIAAYEKGGEWLKELQCVLWANREYAEKELAEKVPAIKCVSAQATYLLWLDCQNITKNTVALAQFIRKDTGLVVTEGDEYGKSGQGFLRVNLACPRERLVDGIQRLVKGLKDFSKQ